MDDYQHYPGNKGSAGIDEDGNDVDYNPNDDEDDEVDDEVDDEGDDDVK